MFLASCECGRVLVGCGWGDIIGGCERGECAFSLIGDSSATINGGKSG